LKIKMKLTILVASLIVCLSVGISAANENKLIQALNDPVFKDPFLKYTEETLLSLVPDTLEDLYPLVESAFRFFILGQLDPGSREVIIAPGLLPHLIPLPALNLINLDIGPGLVVGNLTFNNVQLEGLHTLTDTVAADVEPVEINANYTIVIPILSLNSDYMAKLVVNIPDLGAIDFVGEGPSYINVTKIALNVGSTITPRSGTNGVQFAVKLTFGIDAFDVFFGNLVSPPIEDWTELNDILRLNIVPLVQGLLDASKVQNILTLLFDELTKECTFREMMDYAQGVVGSDLSCVVIPGPPPRPTQPPVPVSEEPEREKNGASAIGFDNMMYLEILAVIGAFYSAFKH